MIPVYQPFFEGNEKKYVNQCLDSTWISSKGEFISKFENEFSNYIGAPYATTVANGTVALHLALVTLGIGPGDEVIVPTLTYIASVNTIMQTGATPVFVDSLASSWQVDSADIERNITPKTKAIMVVHLYGQPCDMDAIVPLCKKHGLMLVEDCAESFGSTYKGRHTGTFGDIATFSFFGNKTITTGEGGMVVAKAPEVIERAYHLKTQGVSSQQEYWHDEVAYNYRMTNICAAIGLAQLEQVKTILARKRRIALWYTEHLQGLPLLCHEEQPDSVHSFWMCSILLDEAADRQLLRTHLKKSNIETRPFFFPAHTMPHCHSDFKFPVAEALSAKGINLPSFPSLTTDELTQICNSIRSYFK